MIELTLPEIGENIETAEVSRILVAEGDTVQAEQNVLELESDKASFPLPSTHAGRVARILVKVGDTVEVGQTLLQIDESEKAAAKPAEKTVAKAKAAAAPAHSTAAKSGEETPSVSQAAPQEPAAPAAAAPKTVREKPKSTAAAISEEAPASTSDKDRKRTPSTERTQQFVAAGPATRTLARELGVPLEQVEGHGPGGRITREDVKSFVQQRLSADGSPQHVEGAPSTPPLPDFGQWGTVSRQRLSPLARTSADRLSLAWRTVPHVTQHDLADFTELEAARKRYNDSHAGKNDSAPRITATALAVRAAVTALKAFPRFNSSLDAATGELVLKSYYHIGLAVDTEQGLLVPVLRDADRKSLLQIAQEVAELAEKARARSLTKKDMEGGTFTISNLGGIGGTSFTPIVNYPEAAILGMSRASWQLVPAGDKTEKRLMLPLSLSYDHRIVNGADGARFLVKLAALLSDPFQLLAEA